MLLKFLWIVCYRFCDLFVNVFGRWFLMFSLHDPCPVCCHSIYNTITDWVVLGILIHTYIHIYNTCTYGYPTGGCIKTPTQCTIIYGLMIYFDLHNINVYDRYGFHHILIKIEWEIFWKKFWPLKFEFWIWIFDR